jgi:DEAD/DEAH box helicase domain-containing protein
LAGLGDILAAQVVHVEEIQAKSAQFGVPARKMHPQLIERLQKQGLSNLYTHQAEAYDAAISGKDVVVVTGTNSGKTLCYNLPAIQTCLTEPAGRCLYLFPTKALAQDQLKRLEKLTGPEVRVGAYDGDTAQSQRGSIRRLAHIVLTNPDMLHVGILPGHENWAKFLKSLRVIVIDEMHVYRGVFGSHVGNVLRRLLRLCEWHRTRPQIIACSATIGNPTELFRSLTGRSATLIEGDGAPSGKRTFVFWNPPETASGARLSANVCTSEILGTLAESNLRTLAFSRARVSAELVLRYTRKKIEQDQIISPLKIESYRAGYTPKERREIEGALFRGDILGLSATNALELGVDVGALDAVVLNGYPGTTSSFWQQAGRAGRGSKDGLAIFVAHDDPLEQFFMREPRMVLDARNESVSANPQNPQIVSQHLLCAAHERPIAPSELDRFGTGAVEVAEGLDRSGELQFRAGLFFYPSMEPPAPNVNIRNGGGEQVRLYLDGEELGSMERTRAMMSAHTGAVYLHRGRSFLVRELDLPNMRAEVTALEVDYYTQSLVESSLEVNVDLRAKSLKMDRDEVYLSGVSVTDVVTGFRRKSLDGDTVVSHELLDLPPITYDTVSTWLDLPETDYSTLGPRDIGAYHGLEHALMAVAPLICGCDRSDLGSTWFSVFHRTMRPALFVYDKTPGGVGLCETLYDSMTGWIRAAIQLVSSCPCEDGCPSCLLSSRCESNNEMLDKQSTLELMERLL